MTEAAELQDLIAEPRLVRAGGRDVAIRPLSPRQIPRFLAAVKPLQAALGTGLKLDKLEGSALAAMVETHTEDVVQAVAIAVREHPDFIGDEIDMAELIELAAAVIEVNADFFARRMAPAMVGVMAQLHRLSAGRLPSSGS